MFHFVKLRHNVTVFTRDDPFHMGDVMHPYFWKGFRCRVEGSPPLICSSWLLRQCWNITLQQRCCAACTPRCCP